MNENIRHTMYNFFVRGIITEREWKTWCHNYLCNVILPCPVVSGVMVRLKNM